MNSSKYIELLRDLVRTPSLSFEEEKAADLLCGNFEKWGWKYLRLRNNIVLLSDGFDRRKKTLALDAHIDTVPPNAEYSFDPFDPGDDPSRVRGLGSNDDGASVVSMMAAFDHFRAKGLSLNLMLVLSCEEERSGENGARWLYSPDGPFDGISLPRPDWVIVGEPTSMKAATSERGLLVIDGLAEGVSAHAARSEEGENALYKALEDIAALRAYEFGKVSPTMGKVRLNVTQISSGSVHNVIPDRCSFVVDIRPTEQYDNEEILSSLQKLCRGTLKARNLHNRSSATSEDSPLMKAIMAMGLETFSSPTTSDWMRIPCEALKIGPGDSCRSHKADEYVLTSEIEEAVDIYIRLIELIADQSKGIADLCRQ